MTTITIKLPEDLTAQLQAEQISRRQLDSFLAAAVRAWLIRRRAASHEQQPGIEERSWSEAFQDNAVSFVDQLIDENQALFEEMARL